MTENNMNPTQNGSPFWLKVVKELGALGIVGGMAYYILVNHEQSTVRNSEMIANVMRENTQAVQELTISIKTWNLGQAKRPEAANIQRP